MTRGGALAGTCENLQPGSGVGFWNAWAWTPGSLVLTSGQSQVISLPLGSLLPEPAGQEVFFGQRQLGLAEVGLVVFARQDLQIRGTNCPPVLAEQRGTVCNERGVLCQSIRNTDNSWRTTFYGWPESQSAANAVTLTNGSTAGTWAGLVNTFCSGVARASNVTVTNGSSVVQGTGFPTSGWNRVAITGPGLVDRSGNSVPTLWVYATPSRLNTVHDRFWRNVAWGHHQYRECDVRQWQCARRERGWGSILHVIRGGPNESV